MQTRTQKSPTIFCEAKHKGLDERLGVPLPPGDMYAIRRVCQFGHGLLGSGGPIRVAERPWWLQHRTPAMPALEHEYTA